MKLSRRAMRALRKLPRPIPPHRTADKLAAEYHARWDHWFLLVQHNILDRWDSPRSDAKGGPVDPKKHVWIDSKIRALRADMGEDLRAASLSTSIMRAATDVDTKATKYIKSLVPISIRNSDIGPKLDAFRRANLDKIKSLGAEQVDRLGEYLLESELVGRSTQEMRKAIAEEFEIGKSKASLLARDQTLKLNGQVTRERQTQAGISRYVWTTTGGPVGTNLGDVRPMHGELDGQVFSWDDPPITNDDGDTNHPGEDYQCRCVATPVVPSIEDLDDLE